MKAIAAFQGAVILMPLLGCARATHQTGTILPAVHHILLEVADLNASIAFYRDVIGLQRKSHDGHFATLEAENAGVFLWDKRWDWEAPRVKGERPGLGMYPHFKVANVAAVVNRARQAGYKIIQEPKQYGWGTEAFISDSDGYVWAIIN